MEKNIQLIETGRQAKVYRIKGKDGIEIAYKRNKKVSEIAGTSCVTELVFLQELKHKYIVGALNFVEKDLNQFIPIKEKDGKYLMIDDEINIKLECGGLDLDRFIEQFRVEKYQYVKFMLHALLGMKYIHDLRVIHRDIKPSNFIVFPDEIDLDGNEGVLKICDFGQSKIYHKLHDNTLRVCNEYYRAPEIMLEGTYDYKIDIWSLGCTFFFMFLKYNFMQDKEPRSRIMTILSRHKYIDPIKTYKKFLADISCRKRLKIDPERFSEINKDMPSLYDEIKDFLDISQDSDDDREQNDRFKSEDIASLISSMLYINPDDRPTACELLNNKLFRPYKNVIDSDKKLQKNTIYRELGDIIEVPRHKVSLFIRTETIEWIIKNKEKEWMEDRIKFTIMNILDRFLVKLEKNEKIINSLDNFNIEIIYLTIAYFCIKYHRSVDLPPELKTVVNSSKAKYTPKHKKFIERTELELINSVSRYLFYDNIYDCIETYKIYDDVDGHINMSGLFTWSINIKNIEGKYPIDVVRNYCRL